MKKVILCILALFGSSMAKADDEKDFYRQIEGWEWIYQEPCKRENIEYPKSVGFYTYDSHPEYRVTDREFYNIWGGFEEFLVCIYDREGKLVRVSCLLGKQTVELNSDVDYYKFEEHETLVIKKVKDKLLNRMMVESYWNNKYDIKNREPLEILNVIEERLGLKEPQETDENSITIEMVCELLRVKYYQGITRNDVAAQLKNKYPYKDDMDIQNMILEAFTKASTLRLLSLNAETKEKMKREQPATNYINQLEKDHRNDNEISSIERTGNTSFKITFNTKTSKSKFYAYVWFYSDEPYSYKFKIDIKADWYLKGK